MSYLSWIKHAKSDKNNLQIQTLLNNTSYVLPVIHMKELSLMINLSYYSVSCCSHCGLIRNRCVQNDKVSATWTEFPEFELSIKKIPIKYNNTEILIQ